MKPSLFKSTLLGDVLNFFNGKSIKTGGDGAFPGLWIKRLDWAE